MPWQCKSCSVEVHDNARCPGCNGTKNAWTIVADKTRTMVLQRKKFELLEGDGTESLPADQAGAAEVSLDKAERIRVLPKSTVKAIHDEGKVPATADVIFVALHHVNHKDHDVLLEVIYEGQPSEELEFPQEPPSEPPPVVYRKFLFVYGAEPDLADVSFEDLQIVDLTEDDGCAGEVSFQALGRKEQELPAEVVKGGLTLSWEPPEAEPGDEVVLRVEVEADDDWSGAEVELLIFHADGTPEFTRDDGFESEHSLEQLEPAPLGQGNLLEVRWTLPDLQTTESVEEAFVEAFSPSEDQIQPGAYAYSFRAEAKVKGLTGSADLQVLAAPFVFSL